MTTEKTIRDQITGRLLRTLKTSAPLTANALSEAAGVGLATTRRLLLEMAQAQQVQQVGTVITDDGSRNRDTWAPSGWTAPYDKTAVNCDLLQPIMMRLARRRSETAVSLAVELGRPQGEREATMACLAQAGRLRATRVGPLAIYHMVEAVQ